MTAPLDGVRVLEVASWLAAPSCAALMADMGASVIKVEPPGGDTYRRTLQGLFGEDFVHPSFQFDNRGKRGVCVNFDSAEGLELVHRLARDADVFITNLTAPRLQSTGSPMPTCTRCRRRRSMRCCRATARRPGFTAPGVRPDRVLGALRRNERIRRPRRRAADLARRFRRPHDVPEPARGDPCSDARARPHRRGPIRRGDAAAHRHLGARQRRHLRALPARSNRKRTSQKAPANPIWNFYETSDGRYLALVMPAALPYWPKFCAMIGKPEWITDARFQTLLGMAEHGPAMVPEIAAMFAAHDLAYWRNEARRRRTHLGTGRIADSEVIDDPGAARTRRVLDDRAPHRRRDGDHFGAVSHSRRRRRSARTGARRRSAHARSVRGSGNLNGAHRRVVREGRDRLGTRVPSIRGSWRRVGTPDSRAIDKWVVAESRCAGLAQAIPGRSPCAVPGA